MNPMRWIAGIGMTIAAALVAVPSFAVPTINVTASETISTVPPRYKTTFTLQLVGYNPPGAWGGMRITSSGLGPAVGFYGVECPSYPWSCNLLSNVVAVYGKDGGGLDGPAVQFSMVTDQQVPCVTIRFLDMLLSKASTPRLESDYVITACLAVDMPTPASASSWGGIKAIYR